MEQSIVSLLRIYASIAEPPDRCQWAYINAGLDAVAGEGPLTSIPRRAERTQLIIPANQVLITRAMLPPEINRRAGSVLAYAIEDQLAGEPEANHVSWLGATAPVPDDATVVNAVLAVIDKQGLRNWSDALDENGIRDFEVQCEMLLLPLKPHEWSLAWDGHEGFMRTAELEGATTDFGDRESPPLSLRLALEEAEQQGVRPQLISIFARNADAAPDMDAWQRTLGVPVRLAGPWDWRTALSPGGVNLTQERRHWHGFRRLLNGLLPRLRPAAWVIGLALTVHAASLTADWMLLAREQQALRQQIAERFRTVFPEAVSVSDPALQLRHKLAQMRHAVGQQDDGDFLPMIAKVAAAMSDLPQDMLRNLSYEYGKMTIEISDMDDARLRAIVSRLTQLSLNVDTSAASVSPAKGARTSDNQPRKVVIMVRSS